MNNLTEKLNNDIAMFDIGQIVSDNELKEILVKIMSEFEEQRSEAMDAYFEFRNMVANSGDFDSSQASKEQIAALLKVANDASSSKSKILESIIRAKIKQNTYNITQNNLFVGNRRELLQAISAIPNNLIENSEEKQEEIIEVQDIQEENKQEKIVKEEVLEEENKIESGEF